MKTCEELEKLIYLLDINNIKWKEAPKSKNNIYTKIEIDYLGYKFLAGINIKDVRPWLSLYEYDGPELPVNNLSAEDVMYKLGIFRPMKPVTNKKALFPVRCDYCHDMVWLESYNVSEEFNKIKCKHCLMMEGIKKNEEKRKRPVQKNTKRNSTTTKGAQRQNKVQQKEKTQTKGNR